ncbi:MAG: hypothetical protein OXC80_06120, partial [Gammaproteobacteria bacterium]|nr:hypothetical protein [Gammaproteobacteria bacterium]
MLFALPFFGMPASGSLYEDRLNYRQAKYALEVGRTTEYRELRETLGDYVLTTYLDYYEKAISVSRIKPEQAIAIRSEFSEYSLG